MPNSSTTPSFWDLLAMDPAAIIKAEARLQRAKAALAQIEKATTYPEFESAWTDFLLAANSVYTILEQGAKTTPRSRQWFGSKKSARRADELLQYLHQARNADEHGLRPITHLKPGSIGLGPGPSGRLVMRNVKIHSNPNGTEFSVQGESIGDPPAITVKPPTATLVTVMDDRYKTRFDPPTTHLGTSLAFGISPLEVAKLGYTYHASLVQEARSLA